MAWACPDSPLTDVRLRSPLVMPWHVTNLPLPPVVRDFLQPPQHITFGGPCG